MPKEIEKEVIKVEFAPRFAKQAKQAVAASVNYLNGRFMRNQDIGFIGMEDLQALYILLDLLAKAVEESGEA